MIYQGVKQNAARLSYRLGLALLDFIEPECCLERGNKCVFGPEGSYERQGEVDKVVFPCGYTLDGDRLRIYAGVSDASNAVATGSVQAMLQWWNEAI